MIAFAARCGGVAAISHEQKIPASGASETNVLEDGTRTDGRLQKNRQVGSGILKVTPDPGLGSSMRCLLCRTVVLGCPFITGDLKPALST